MLPAEIDLQTKRIAAANVRQMARECTSANEFARLLEIATQLEVEAGALAHRTDCADQQGRRADGWADPLEFRSQEMRWERSWPCS
jgi:hypothetical protein